jgi:hypothetical protein
MLDLYVVPDPWRAAGKREVLQAKPAKIGPLKIESGVPNESAD